MFNSSIVFNRFVVILFLFVSCRVSDHFFLRYDKRMKAFDFEIVNKLGGETYHTIKRLLDSSLVDEYDFSLVIGMDNANTFDKWYNYKELERLIRNSSSTKKR